MPALCTVVAVVWSSNSWLIATGLLGGVYVGRVPLLFGTRIPASASSMSPLDAGVIDGKLGAVPAALGRSSAGEVTASRGLVPSAPARTIIPADHFASAV